MVQIAVIALLTFGIGGILLMERHCLGKSAFVQPLVLCLATGMITGYNETCLWLGISLQLLSIGQDHYCNWALAAVVSCASILTLGVYDIQLEQGYPATVVLLCSSIVFSIISRALFSKLGKRQAKPMQSIPVWKSEGSFDEFKRLVHRQVSRAFVQSGILSVIGTAVTVIFTTAIQGIVAVNETVLSVVLVVIPVFGVAVTIASMSGKRYSLFSGIGVAVFLFLVVIL